MSRTPLRSAPWSFGGKIPWNEPGFSRRMLAEHLSQAHDGASRRFELIDRQIEALCRWLPRPSRVLDAGCGPGLYCERLARRGHHCVGVDFAPASIGYARGRAEESGLACEYIEADLCEFQPDGPFDLALLLFGEFNAFPPEQAAHVLESLYAALAPGGRLVLEVSTEVSIEATGRAPRHDFERESGLFSDRPHAGTRTATWHPDARASVEHYRIVDRESGDVAEYASTGQAYGDDEYREILRRAGFGSLEVLDALGTEPLPGLFILTALRPPSS